MEGTIGSQQEALLLTWYLIGQEICPDPKDDTRPIIESLINEILLETSDPDNDDVAQLQRVVLPLSIVEDLLRDTWIWRGMLFCLVASPLVSLLIASPTGLTFHLCGGICNN